MLWHIMEHDVTRTHEMQGLEIIRQSKKGSLFARGACSGMGSELHVISLAAGQAIPGVCISESFHEPC